MKKKVLALLLAGVMVCSTVACGGDTSTGKSSDETSQTSEETGEQEAADTEDETAAENETAAEDEAGTEGKTVADAEAATGAAEDEFTLLDVSADMVDAGLYAVDENGKELVFTLFTIPSGEAMCSLFVFDADGNGDVICGEYTGATETDEDNISWTRLDFTDVYTDTDKTIGCAEGDDGTCYIYNEAGEVYTAEYLDADSVIDYMGAAVNLLDEQ